MKDSTKKTLLFIATVAGSVILAQMAWVVFGLDKTAISVKSKINPSK